MPHRDTGAEPSATNITTPWLPLIFEHHIHHIPATRHTMCERDRKGWILGPWFNIKMSSYQYRKSCCGYKTVVRSSYLHNGFPILIRWHLYIEPPCGLSVSIGSVLSWPQHCMWYLTSFLVVPVWPLSQCSYIIPDIPMSIFHNTSASNTWSIFDVVLQSKPCPQYEHRIFIPVLIWHLPNRQGWVNCNNN